MPYKDEFARTDTLLRFGESTSVKEFNGIIRQYDGSEIAQTLPPILPLERGTTEVRHVVAIDGSTVTCTVEQGFPGAQAAAFHLGVVIIDIGKVRDFPSNYIPRPKEMRSLEKVKTLSAVLPGRNVVRRDMPSDTSKNFFRFVVNKEFNSRLDPDHETLFDTYHEIIEKATRQIRCPMMEDCPMDNKTINVQIEGGCCDCHRNESIYGTDALRLHERFSDVESSEQAFTGFRQVIEQLALLNIMRYFEQREQFEVFQGTAFVLDGPLAIFGMPAWLQGPIQKEVERLHKRILEVNGQGLLLMGVEKSGLFMDHFERIDWAQEDGPRGRIENGTAFAVPTEYAHKYIVLRPIDAKPHGQDTYWGRKILYKTKTGNHTVFTVPIVNEQGKDYNCCDPVAFPRLNEALNLVDELGTHLYEDGFAPLVRAHRHAAIPLRSGERILKEMFKGA